MTAPVCIALSVLAIIAGLRMFSVSRGVNDLANAFDVTFIGVVAFAVSVFFYLR